MTNKTFEQVKLLKPIAKNSGHRPSLAVVNVTENHIEATDSYRLITMEKQDTEDKTTGLYLQETIGKYKEELEKDDTRAFPNCNVIREKRNQDNENTARLDLKYLKSIIDVMIKQGNKYADISISDSSTPVFIYSDKEVETNNLTVDAMIMPVQR